MIDELILVNFQATKTYFYIAKVYLSELSDETYWILPNNPSLSFDSENKQAPKKSSLSANYIKLCKQKIIGSSSSELILFDSRYHWFSIYRRFDIVQASKSK